MMKSNRTFVALSFLACLNGIACTKSGSESKSNVDILPKYTLAKADLDKLRDVGCDFRDQQVNCDDISPSQVAVSADPLAMLKLQESRATKQKTAIDEVNVVVSKAAKTDRGVEADILSAELTGASAKLESRLADLTVQIMNENNYQTTIGFNCESSYIRDGQEVKAKSSLLTASTGQQNPSVRDDSANYISALELVHTARIDEITYRLVDNADPKAQTLRQAVETDGEFTAESKEGALGKMNCARSRLYGSTFPFSDRPADSTYYKCGITSTFKGDATRVSHSFPVSVRGEQSFDIIAIMPVDKDMNDLPIEQGVHFQKYMGHASTSKGILSIQIEDLTQKRTVMTFATVNTAKNFRLALDDNQKNSFEILCEAKSN